MVVLCKKPYHNSNYESYFELYPYPLSDFQKYAIQAIADGQHALVTAKTGSGKTLPAEFAIQHFVGAGKKVIYCSPIKALTNQKYYEFTKKYPHISFGIFTGDIKANPEADVLIMTTEILMNHLFLSTSSSSTPDQLQFQMNLHTELGCVVFDEVHYINDLERGHVWEKTILMLPLHIQLVLLSATIDNPERFAKWIESRDQACEKSVWLASTTYRVVPLTHYGFLTTTESFFKTCKDKVVSKQVRDATNTLVTLQEPAGKFNDAGYVLLQKTIKTLDSFQIRSHRKHVLNRLAGFLCERDMLPAIAFVFSRKQVEVCASEITVSLLEDDSKVGYTVRRECEQIVRKLPNYQEYLELPEYVRLVDLLEKGIGIHHSGMIPILREIVELMISKKYIKLLFATESFAIGLDCPIRTAIFTSLTKFDGHNERLLLSHEYTQMAGRAGRRGIDTVGHVVHCNNLFPLPTMGECKTVLAGVPQKLVSKFKISYGLVLHLCLNTRIAVEDIATFSTQSMAQVEICDELKCSEETVAQLEKRIEEKRVANQFLKCPIEICLRYMELKNGLGSAINKKRRDMQNEITQILDEYRTIESDVGSVKELIELEMTCTDTKQQSQYTRNYMISQSQQICEIMIEKGILEVAESMYSLTKLGLIASGIAEVHPLIVSELVVRWNFFEGFTVRQIIGFFSCFTDVKVSQDERRYYPVSEDLFLKQRVQEAVELHTAYDVMESSKNVHTGFDYEGAMQFDMIDFSMEWVDCLDEQSCKHFIQTKVAEKGISIGDFTKAMLKIVTIVKEWMRVCEMRGEIAALHKLSYVEGFVLKYVATNQSLYI
jgi:superfamily II RNA helicase